MLFSPPFSILSSRRQFHYCYAAAARIVRARTQARSGEAATREARAAQQDAREICADMRVMRAQARTAERAPRGAATGARCVSSAQRRGARWRRVRSTSWRQADAIVFLRLPLITPAFIFALITLMK